MICPICGSHLNDDLKFCTQCGTPLTNTAPVDDNPTELFSETSAPQADVYQPNAPQMDVYQPNAPQAPVYDATPYDAAPSYDTAATFSQDYASFEPAPEEKKGGKLGLIFGIISLVLGVISPIFCCCGWIGAIFGIVFSLITVVMGIVGIVTSKKGNKVGKILSIIGLILGALVLVVSAIYLVVVLVAGGSILGLGLLENAMYY